MQQISVATAIIQLG